MAKTYDPSKVLITYNNFALSGFADGTFATVTRNEDMWTLSVGCDGEDTRSKSNNKSGTFEITLMQSSESNQILSDFMLADELSNSGSGPLLVKDASSGTTLYMAEQAWIKKAPDSEFGRESGSRTWVFETGVVAVNIGGYEA